MSSLALASLRLEVALRFLIAPTLLHRINVHYVAMFMYFGFVLSEWEEFENLKATLISAGRFQADRAIQRALYQYSADMVSISFLRWHLRRLTNPVASHNDL